MFKEYLFEWPCIGTHWDVHWWGFEFINRKKWTNKINQMMRTAASSWELPQCVEHHLTHTWVGVPRQYFSLNRDNFRKTLDAFSSWWSESSPCMCSTIFSPNEECEYVCVCVSVCRCVCMDASRVGRDDDVRELTINQEENIKTFQRKNGRLEGTHAANMCWT